MTTSSNEASKTVRVRSLRFMNHSNTSTDYELPSLRAKPRQKQDSGSGNDIDDDSNAEDDSDTGDDATETEHDELSDSPSEDSDLEQDSDDGSVFSMEEVDDLDNEEELANPTRSRDRNRRQQRQQQDTSMVNNNNSSRSSSRKRRLGHDEDDEDSMSPKLDGNSLEQATPSSSGPNKHHHPKKRKLRPSHAIRSATIYNELLSDDSEWMDQDLGIQYTNDMDIVMNDRRGKSTTTSPLMLGSPSKVVKAVGGGGGDGRKQRQQHDGSGISAALLSPDRIDKSPRSSTHGGVSPLSKQDEKKWPRRPQASSFLDKLQVKEEDTLDLSQHSFIPDDFLETHRKTAAATTTTPGNHGSRGEKTTHTAKNNGGGPDDISDSDEDLSDMAYQYDFSTISQPGTVAANPPSDPILDDHGDPHTQASINPPTPTPNTSQEDEPQQTPSFFRRIAAFIFG